MIDVPDNRDRFEIEKPSESLEFRRLQGVYRVEERDSFHKQKQDRKKNPLKKELVKDRFSDLENLTKERNEFLAQKKCPYRFCIYREGEQVFLSLVFLNSEGRIEREMIKDISFKSFEKIWMEIAQGKGLYYEGDA